MASIQENLRQQAPITPPPNLEVKDFCHSKVLLPHALDEATSALRLARDAIEFSTVLPTLSPYHKRYHNKLTTVC